MLVGDILRTTAARYPNKIGVIFGDKHFTWQEVNARVNRLANGLLSLGLKKQDRVVILSRNNNQYLEYYFATAKAGLVAVPLNIGLKRNELTQLIKNSGANTIIADSERVAMVESLGLAGLKHYIGLDEGHPFPNDLETLISQNSSDEPGVRVEESDLFTLSYTSGTTGLPKGAMITHKNACAGITNLALEWRLLPHDVYLLHAPFFFAAGGGARLHAVLRACTCIIMTYSADAVLQAVQKYKVTRMSFSPTPIKRIIDHPDISKYDLSSVQLIGLSGATHSVAEIKKIEQIFGHVWCSTYGLAETVNCGTCLQPEEVAVEGPLSRRLASVGNPMIGVDVRVVNENGRDIARDGKEVGEVIFRGDMVSRGYYGMPDITAETIKDGWFYTGDLVSMDEDGYLYIVDRKKDMIKSGGVQIWPREIEEIVYTHPAVAQCAVIGVPHEEWGETPKVVVALKPGMKATEAEIIELCKRNLASFKKPTSVDFLDSLPLTASGKILKRDLRERYWKGYEKRVH